MPLLYRIMWALAIFFVAITTVVFSVWIIIIGAVLYTLYRIYLYFFLKKRGVSFQGKSGQNGRIYYKVYTNTDFKGYGPSADQQSPRGFTNGEVIDMPVEEITDSQSSLPKE
ncbi:hypothetical protein Desdi_0823 [Desulfitobacterium dichloroeliminans LMG P-21439]|uniref:Uncharacterized protein n=1 Tax=Desulfitobacterium dichloroeliminans (strain LMG P-21439 / DCA1) TaxID=871963 RepID=L0F5V5_DESDL|nr:hypothetical protein [Desulfitobacterium dichloroeliminans]AGA68348.1 hypothetical protein Desdi_0823 [Desulfitobacterium dichloroeliminans LMG P-21439]